MKRCNDKIQTIGIFLDISYASARDILYGISRYSRAHFHWNINIPNAGNVPVTPSDLMSLDGIITIMPLPKRPPKDKPVVVLGTEKIGLDRRKKNIAFVSIDNLDIGKFAAEYFSRLGRFRSFGFVPDDKPIGFSELRRKGFCRFLEETHRNATTYRASDAGKGSTKDIRALGEWLLKLPKPAAVMAACDLRAMHVLSAARNIGLKVPGELCVIGVDNDELLCDFTSPRLTSIAPDHIHLGELAAKEMGALLAQADTGSPRTIFSGKKKLVERESAAPTTPSARLVDEAMSIITRDALKGIRAADISRKLGVSRRLLDLRFRECTGSSILGTLLDIRLDEIRRQLITSAIPIKNITANCGFSNEYHAKRMFKAKFGMTMRQYRSEQGRLAGQI